MSNPIPTAASLGSIGGRKFALSVIGILSITLLALNGADGTAYGSIALIVGAFTGGNAYIEGKHASQ